MWIHPPRFKVHPGTGHDGPEALDVVDCITPGKEAQYPMYRRLGGLQGRSGRVRKISPPTRFDPRTVQPVASRYTDWAIPAQSNPRFRDVIFGAQSPKCNRWQEKCKCTEIRDGLYWHSLQILCQQKRNSGPLKRRREMYASRSTVVLYDVWKLNPFQVAITVICGHSFLCVLAHLR
jgi:hypothetical protein